MSLKVVRNPRPRRTADWQAPLTSARHEWWPDTRTEEQREMAARAAAYYAARDAERAQREAEAREAQRRHDEEMRARAPRS